MSSQWLEETAAATRFRKNPFIIISTKTKPHKTKPKLNNNNSPLRRDAGNLVGDALVHLEIICNIVATMTGGGKISSGLAFGVVTTKLP